MNDLVYLGFLGALVALAFAWVQVQCAKVISFSESSEKMRKTAGSIREGANAYLKHQYISTA